MREKLSPIAPYIAAFGLVLIVGALGVRQTNTGPDWLPLAIGAAGLVLLLAYPVGRADEMRDLFGSRQARFGGNALVMAVSVIGILVVINILGTLRFVKIDTTKNQRFAISGQSKTVLDDLREQGQQIKITAVMPSSSPTLADVRQLMDYYTAYGNVVSFAAIDAATDPRSAIALQTSIGGNLTNNEVVVQAGDKHEVVYAFDEKAITGAIIKVTRPREKVVAFTTGHKEYSPTGGDQRAYSGIAQFLERDGYKVVTVQLATSDTLTADVLVVAGAQEPFNSTELERLAKFSADGGGVLVLADPQDKADLSPLLQRYGMSLRNDLALDPERALQSPAVPVITKDGFQFHEITSDMTNPEPLLTIFPGARSVVVPSTAPSGTTTSSLLKTSDAAWGETDLAALEVEGAQPVKDDVDAGGPLDLAAAAEPAAGADAGAAKGPGRLVVVGSASWVSDAILQQINATGNGVFVLNSINWLAQDEELMGIRATEPDDRPLRTPQNPILLFLVTTLLLPGVIAAIGFYVWWQRR